MISNDNSDYYNVGIYIYILVYTHIYICVYMLFTAGVGLGFFYQLLTLQ